MSDRLKKLVRDLKDELGVPPGLAGALEEMGPNHLTEFADGLEIEGYPKPPGGHFPMWEDLGALQDRLTDFMVGKELGFAGGVVARSLGLRAGPTRDYDILTALGEPYKAIWKFLEAEGFTYLGSREGVDQFRHPATKFEIDVLMADNPLYKEALSTAADSSWHGKKLKSVDRDHFAAMKTKAYAERRDPDKRATDRMDVLNAISKGTDPGKLREILERTAPQFLPALEEILASKP